MSENKINPKEFHRLARSGKNLTEIARHFGVSVSACSQHAAKMKTAANKAVVLRHADRLLKQDLDLLAKCSTQERRLLASADYNYKIMQADPTTLATAKKVREELTRTQFTDPGALYLQSIRELSNLLKIKKDLLTSLFDVQQVAGFQREILEILSDAHPDVRRAVIKKLKENKALAASLKISRN
jgi:hypothetical protein